MTNLVFLAATFFLTADTPPDDTSRAPKRLAQVDTGPALPPPAAKPVTAADVKRLLEKYRDEPTVQELQERAVRHAAVHPSRVKSLLRRVRTAALLPEFRTRLNKNLADDRTQTTSGTTQYVDDQLRFEFRVTWEFDRLIFDKNEVALARASADLVELRTELVNEVTKLYFERRRLQIELDLDPPRDLLARVRTDLRIDELSAALDALTGGALAESRRTKNARVKTREKKTPSAKAATPPRALRPIAARTP
ncbi:MAG: hypothetical protein HYY84_05225 [Deltaproteobacteria bacterium]|nr:hypothetical protein [Deltaproteobacteria bacterium]